MINYTRWLSGYCNIRGGNGNAIAGYYDLDALPRLDPGGVKPVANQAQGCIFAVS